MRTSADYKNMILSTIEDSVDQGRVTREQGCTLYGMVSAFFLLKLMTGDDTKFILNQLEKIYGLSGEDWDRLLI